MSGYSPGDTIDLGDSCDMPLPSQFGLNLPLASWQAMHIVSWVRLQNQKKEFKEKARWLVLETFDRRLLNQTELCIE